MRCLWMFFDNLYGLLRVVLISMLAYGWLVLTLRITGKRTLSKLNAFDLVVTVALGSTLAHGLTRTPGWRERRRCQSSRNSP